ncbi:MAG TPA: hypothetical protein VFB45_02645 [Pseudolabrys sp.]|nr:hypothetical protein [Pseudolabrys sp.]
MSKFNYDAPAELFASPNRRIARPFKYKRLDTAANAIRFAVAELSQPALVGACIETGEDEERLDHKHIRELYDSADYPLKRGPS